MADLLNRKYNPDVLTCLANLSNDEVFTPPELANKVIDLLPKELWSDPTVKVLDPFCKSGVFLREAARRFIEGLEPIYPDLQERVDHIMHEQLFGIAITELTSLLSRRSLYCSKFPNGHFSVSEFDGEEGNVRYRNIQHTWRNKRCIYCGASQDNYDRGADLETHAYEFIHTTHPEEIFDMKFDVIVGNPPYQLSVGNTAGNSSKAKAIYHMFVSQAIKLNPRYLCMITPSRWMTKTTEGIPEAWVDEMLRCNRFIEMHDFEDASECFPGVEIKGGVNYFLWDRNYEGKCRYYYHSKNQGISQRFDYLDSAEAGIVIRDPQAYSILNKIIVVEGRYFGTGDKSFSSLVSPKDFFTNKQVLTSSWDGFSAEQNEDNNIKYYVNKNIHKVEFGFIPESTIPKNLQSIKLHKVYIPAAGGTGNDTQILGRPFYGEPGSVCSQTYLVIGYDPIKHNFSKQECENIISYIQTRFFRYLVSVKKKTQNGPRGVYQFVPIQDFARPWTDNDLYEKYGLDDGEIQLIEESVAPMGPAR